MPRAGGSTGKVALVPEFERVVRSLRAHGSLEGNRLAAKGQQIIDGINSGDQDDRRESYVEALGWFSEAKAFLGGR